MLNVHAGSRGHPVPLHADGTRLNGKRARAQGEQEPKSDYRYLPK